MIISMIMLSKWPSSIGMTIQSCVYFIMLIGYTHCYENLSRRPTTILSQSSTYSDQSASYANDGNLSTTWNRCAHTNTGRPKAWFQVDLGKEYSMKSVKIYHRKDGDVPGEWKQYRFRQFYLDVSNSSAAMTDTTQRTRCYTDNSTGSDLPDNIIELPCNQTARYIIVETTYDAPEDDIIAGHGAILEICEIQVYGCEIGKYGEACQDCSGCQTCDIISGVCPSPLCNTNCIGGLCNSTTGHCTKGCANGYRGNTCTLECPRNCNKGTCDQNNGHCTQSCSNGYWGNTCTSACSSNCHGGMCNQTNGFCINGCSKGYWEYTCRRTCPQTCQGGGCDSIYGNCSGCSNNSYWGQMCNETCPQNCNGGVCDQNYGYCAQNCTDGYWGKTCTSVCPRNCQSGGCYSTNGYCNGCSKTFWGQTCNKHCLQYCNGSVCDQSNGHCTNGCTQGRYGIRCEHKCNVNCAEETCDQQTGKCYGGCKVNWDGNQCDKCISDYYGQLCDKRCSSNCVNGTCFSNNGTCVDGCTGRFIDDKCTQEYHQTCANARDTTMSFVSIALSVIIVLIGSVINVLCWRRNKTLALRKGIKDTVNSQTTAHELSELPTSENPVRSPYAELGDLDKPNTYENLHPYSEAV